MTPADLIARVKGAANYYKHIGNLHYVATLREAADALTAQAERIAELEAREKRLERGYYSEVTAEYIGRLERLRDEAEAREKRLRDLVRESRDAFDCLANKDGTPRWDLAIRIDAALAESQT